MHDKKRGLFERLVHGRGGEPRLGRTAPESDTARQVRILRWVVIILTFIGARFYFTEHEAAAIRNFDKSACWTDDCRLQVSIARLKTLN